MEIEIQEPHACSMASSFQGMTHGASLHGIDILTHSLISPQAADAKDAAKAAAEKKAQASKEAAAAKREAAALKASAGQDAQKQKAAAAAEKV